MPQKFLRFILKSFIRYAKINESKHKKTNVPTRKVQGSSSIVNTDKEVLCMSKLLDAANYLIELFFQTTPTYTCSSTKIAKLLSIANLCAVKHGAPIFTEKIAVNTCGVSIPALNGLLLYSPLGDPDDAEDVDSTITSDQIDDTKIPPVLYQQHESLTEDDMRLLKSVFCHFGAYDAYHIGQAFDGFKTFIADENNGDIDYAKARLFFKDKTIRSIKPQTSLVEAYIMTN